MLEWLRTTFVLSQYPSWDVVLARLCAAAALGGATAAVYAWTHRRDNTFTINFLATLVLLSILLSAVTHVIGDNLARAFGLVGALSIVRFRTVVEDTRDTAFVMLAVVVGMAAGSGYSGLAAATLGLSAITAVILQPRREPPAVAAPEQWTLTVRVGIGHDHEARLQPLFSQFLVTSRLVSVATTRQGAAIEMTWTIGFRPGTPPPNLVTELNRIDGVQNVELRRTGN